MQFIEDFFKYIIAWIISSFVLIIILILLPAESSVLYPISFLAIFIINLVTGNIILGATRAELLSYIKKKYPVEYEKYFYSSFWEMEMNKYNSYYFTVISNNYDDIVLAALKKQFNYARLFLVFQAVYFFLLFFFIERLKN